MWFMFLISAYASSVFKQPFPATVSRVLSIIGWIGTISVAVFPILFVSRIRNHVLERLTCGYWKKRSNWFSTKSTTVTPAPILLNNFNRTGSSHQQGG